MPFPAHVRVNLPSVVHEIIDGEAVIINMNTGCYYSIDEVGAVIWEFISKGAGVVRIVDIVATRYAGEKNLVADGVHDLLEQLLKEDLIVVDPDGQADEQAHMDVETNGSAEKPLFKTPELHMYTDMQDLLLLDPIHDVDESGWPNINPDPA